MTLRIEIVSDFVCPYCWLGKKRLEAALALRPGVAVRRVWRPFELDAAVPAGGQPYRAYMTAVFGGGAEAEQRLDAAWAGLTEAGRAIGADFNFPAMAVRPNTLDAHRLMRWAQQDGLGDACAEALFSANFRDGRDIGDAGTLAGIAAELGMDRETVRARLEGEDDAAAVRAEEQQFRGMGVQGVPTFILDRRFGFSGAHEPDVLAQALDRALAA